MTLRTDDVVFTRVGTVARPQILANIYAVMARPDTDGMTLTALAKEIGIDRKTLKNYLTDEVWDEIKRRRIAALADEEILALDKAIYARALAGDLKAAKLIYERWDSVRAAEKVAAEVVGEEPEVLATALAELRAEIEVLEG